jgi:tetratricopeptide (TPR) repeat protein
VSAAASGGRSLRAASCARKLARRAWLADWLVGGLLLVIATISALAPARATPEERDASLQAHQGRTALLRGQDAEADRLLTQALAATALPATTKVFALSDRGVARWRLGALRAAIEDFNEALRLAPEEATLYNNRGNVLLELKLHAEAAKDFALAIALAPDYGAAYNNRGNARLLLGDPAGAVADFTKAIRLMPANAVPFNGRGKAQLALRRPAGALRDLSRAIALSSRYAQAYANRAEALMALRRYQEAIGDYGSAVQFGADNAETHLGRASAYARLDKPDLAVADLAIAMARDPSLAAAADPRPFLQDTTPPSAAAAGPALASAPASVLHAPMRFPCDDREHPAERAPRLGLPQMAGIVPASLRSPLLYEAKNEPGDAMAEAVPQDGEDRMAPPCGPSTGRAVPAPDGDESAGPELDGWGTAHSAEGDYVATNSDYPGLRLTLEMYGSGEPELLSWQKLTGTFRRTGLLHYYAGTTAEGERLEYIAVVDIKAGHLLAIEPGRWGQRQAEWSWSDVAVVVVDPQGVPSEVKLHDEDSSADRPQHLRHIKRVRRYIPPQLSQRSRPGNWPHAGGFNPWHFR